MKKSIIGSTIVASLIMTSMLPNMASANSHNTMHETVQFRLSYSDVFSKYLINN